ncbi:hypothetical protein, partial [Arthrobacter sp. STN4]|uniref:hypothetical protein n=1 Tax=Arthrobacter sp. STN4 TaxID=2923276 RepID=UPI002119FD9E
ASSLAPSAESTTGMPQSCWYRWQAAWSGISPFPSSGPSQAAAQAPDLPHGHHLPPARDSRPGPRPHASGPR